MSLLTFIAGFPKAHAADGFIDSLGEGAPGIDAMWAQIKAVFPWTTMGGNGLSFVLFKITAFILETIAALAVVMLIYGGIKIITGGEEGLGEGKKIATYALGGLVAAIVADAVVYYIGSLIGVVAS